MTKQERAAEVAAEVWLGRAVEAASSRAVALLGPGAGQPLTADDLLCGLFLDLPWGPAEALVVLEAAARSERLAEAEAAWQAERGLSFASEVQASLVLARLES